MQYKFNPTDLSVILALARAGTLASAASRLEIDASTIFRTIQRIEKGLGQRLFERSRNGYLPSELAQELVQYAEHIEAQLEAAQSIAQLKPGEVSGTVRITSTDTVMHGLIMPSLKRLRENHPQLSFDLHTGNELANLNRRDADIAVRATKKPPQHLVGKRIGTIQVALYGSKKSGPKTFNEKIAASCSWAAPDDELPDHPSVVWRRNHFPKIIPTYRTGSILTVAELVSQGAAIGLLPLFLAKNRTDLRQLSDTLDECQTDLWLLTHRESKHLLRVATVYSFLSTHLQLN